MTDADYNKSLTAAEYDAILIIQAQNPSFSKIEGKELALFYENFDKAYNMGKHINPLGQIPVVGHPLSDAIIWAKKFMENYANMRSSYEKSVHFLGFSFGRLLGGVQFGFKTGNPDVLRYKKNFLEQAQEIVRIIKTINPHLKLKYVPERILKMYHDNPREVHFFTVQFAQELSR